MSLKVLSKLKYKALTNYQLYLQFAPINIFVSNSLNHEVSSHT